ncbi:phage tail tape measure protein [Clostridium perfringens]|nr:phage tail tape measure protein [Clostridium perfringens]
MADTEVLGIKVGLDFNDTKTNEKNLRKGIAEAQKYVKENKKTVKVGLDFKTTSKELKEIEKNIHGIDKGLEKAFGNIKSENLMKILEMTKEISKVGHNIKINVFNDKELSEAKIELEQIENKTHNLKDSFKGVETITNEMVQNSKIFKDESGDVVKRIDQIKLSLAESLKITKDFAKNGQETETLIVNKTKAREKLYKSLESSMKNQLVIENELKKVEDERTKKALNNKLSYFKDEVKATKSLIKEYKLEDNELEKIIAHKNELVKLTLKEKNAKEKTLEVQEREKRYIKETLDMLKKKHSLQKDLALGKFDGNGRIKENALSDIMSLQENINVLRKRLSVEGRKSVREIADEYKKEMTLVNEKVLKDKHEKSFAEAKSLLNQEYQLRKSLLKENNEDNIQIYNKQLNNIKEKYDKTLSNLGDKHLREKLDEISKSYGENLLINENKIIDSKQQALLNSYKKYIAEELKLKRELEKAETVSLKNNVQSRLNINVANQENALRQMTLQTEILAKNYKGIIKDKEFSLKIEQEITQRTKASVSAYNEVLALEKERLRIKTALINTSATEINKVKQLTHELQENARLINEKKNFINGKGLASGSEESRINELKKLSSEYKNYQRVLAETKDRERRNQSSISELTEKIRGLRNEYGKFVRSSEINSLHNKLDNTKAIKDIKAQEKALKELGKAYEEVARKSESAQNGARNIFGSIYDNIKFSATNTLVDAVSNSFFSAWEQLREVDKSYVEFKKVFDQQANLNFDMEGYVDTANQIAIEVGHSTSATLNATAQAIQYGFNKMKEAKEIAKQTLIYSNVADISQDEASKSLISIIKGFNLSQPTKQVEAYGKKMSQLQSILDLLNYTGNNFAITSGGVGDALQRSASALHTAGNDLFQSVELITSANASVQDPSKVGTALKTISSRLMGMYKDKKTGEYKPALRDDILKLSGVDIFTKEGKFKSTYQIIKDLSGVWGGLNDKQQQFLATAIAGRNHLNTFLSLMSNFTETDKKFLDNYKDIAGSAEKENDQFMDSIEGRLNAFRESVLQIWRTIIGRNEIKNIIGLGTGIINVLDTIINKLGLIPTIIGGISALVSLKSRGQTGIGSALINFFKNRNNKGGENEKLNALNQTSKDKEKALVEGIKVGKSYVDGMASGVESNLKFKEAVNEQLESSNFTGEHKKGSKEAKEEKHSNVGSVTKEMEESLENVVISSDNAKEHIVHNEKEMAHSYVETELVHNKTNKNIEKEIVETAEKSGKGSSKIAKGFKAISESTAMMSLKSAGATLAMTGLNAVMGVGIGLAVDLGIRAIEHYINKDKELIEATDKTYESIKKKTDEAKTHLESLEKFSEQGNKDGSVKRLIELDKKYRSGIKLTSDELETYKSLIQKVAELAPEAVMYTDSDGIPYVNLQEGLDSVILKQQKVIDQNKQMMLDKSGEFWKGIKAGRKEAKNIGKKAMYEVWKSEDDDSANFAREEAFGGGIGNSPIGQLDFKQDSFEKVVQRLKGFYDRISLVMETKRQQIEKLRETNEKAFNQIFNPKIDNSKIGNELKGKMKQIISSLDLTGLDEKTGNRLFYKLEDAFKNPELAKEMSKFADDLTQLQSKFSSGEITFKDYKNSLSGLKETFKKETGISDDIANSIFSPEIYDNATSKEQTFINNFLQDMNTAKMKPEELAQAIQKAKEEFALLDEILSTTNSSADLTSDKIKRIFELDDSAVSLFGSTVTEAIQNVENSDVLKANLLQYLTANLDGTEFSEKTKEELRKAIENANKENRKVDIKTEVKNDPEAKAKGEKDGQDYKDGVNDGSQGTKGDFDGNSDKANSEGQKDGEKYKQGVDQGSNGTKGDFNGNSGKASSEGQQDGEKYKQGVYIGSNGTKGKFVSNKALANAIGSGDGSSWKKAVLGIAIASGVVRPSSNAYSMGQQDGNRWSAGFHSIFESVKSSVSSWWANAKAHFTTGSEFTPKVNLKPRRINPMNFLVMPTTPVNIATNIKPTVRNVTKARTSLANSVNRTFKPISLYSKPTNTLGNSKGSTGASSPTAIASPTVTSPMATGVSNPVEAVTSQFTSYFSSANIPLYSGLRFQERAYDIIHGYLNRNADDMKMQIDLNIRLKTSITDLTNALKIEEDRIKNSKSGSERIALMKQEIDLMKQKQTAVESLGNSYENERNLTEYNLHLRGFNFDENKRIVNQVVKLQELEKWVNSMPKQIKKAKKDSDGKTIYEDVENKARTNAEREVADIKALVDKYNTLVTQDIPQQEDAYRELSNSIKNTYQGMLQTVSDVETKITSIIKNQIEERKKVIDEQTKAQTEALRKVKDEMSEKHDNEKYEDSLKEARKKLQEIQEQINDSQLDTTLSGIARTEELKKQLEDQKKRISEMIDQHNYSEAQKQIDNQIKDIETNGENAKKDLDDTWTQKKIEESVREAIYKGHFTDVNGEIRDTQQTWIQFANEFENGLGIMGDKIKSDFIIKLEEAQSIMSNMEEISNSLGYRKTINTMPDWTLQARKSIADTGMRMYSGTLSNTNSNRQDNRTVQFNAPILQIQGSVNNEESMEKYARMIEERIAKSINQTLYVKGSYGY